MQKAREIIFSVYLILLFYYGLAIKLLYGTSAFQYLKFMPEILFAIFLVIVVLKSGKLSLDIYDLILLLLICCIYAISFLASPSTNAVMLSVRDFLFPIISLIVLKNSNVNARDASGLLKIFTNVAISFLIISLYFGFLQHIHTYQYTAKFYTGTVFYGENKEASIKLSTASGVVRALGIAGDSAKYGFYSLISMIVISCWYRTKRALAISFVLAVINIYFSTNKTALLISIVLFIFLYSKLFSGITKKIAIPVMIIGFSLFGYMVLKNPEDFTSLYARFTIWGNGDYLNKSNIVIGTKLFNYFNGGWASIMDNTYLFGACAFGLIAYIIIFTYFVKHSFRISYISDSMLVVFIIGGLSTNLFSARSFIGLFCALCGIEYSLNRKRIDVWAGSAHTTSRKKIRIRI